MMTRAAMRKEKDRLAVQNMASLYYAILYSADCVAVKSSSGKPGRPTHTVYYTLKCRLCVVVESSSAKPGKSTLYYTLTSGLCGSGKLCKTWQAAQNHRLPASPPAKSSNLESRGKEKHFKGEKKEKNTLRD